MQPQLWPLSRSCIFYSRVIFLGQTFLPINASGVMRPAGPFASSIIMHSDYYHIDPGASAWQTEPWTEAVRQQLMGGHFPLWNSNQGLGSPLLANGQSSGLDVLRLPLFLGDSALSWDVYFIIRTIAGGVATFLYAGSIGLVRPARLFCTISYIFSGHFLLLGNNIWIEAYFMLPIILIGSELIVASKLRSGFLVTAVSVALCISRWNARSNAICVRGVRGIWFPAVFISTKWYTCSEIVRSVAHSRGSLAGGHRNSRTSASTAFGILIAVGATCE